jgi:hypothetical protein
MAKRKAEPTSGVSDTVSPASTSVTVESFPTPDTQGLDSSPKSPLGKKQKTYQIPQIADDSVNEDRPAPIEAKKIEEKGSSDVDESAEATAKPAAREPDADVQKANDELSSGKQSKKATKKPAAKKPATKKPATKKPATKKPVTKKKPATKTPRKPTKAKGASGAPPAPKAKRINKVVQAKVKAVGDFLDNTPATESVLRRAPNNADHIVVTELAAISALKAMAADYDIYDPSWTSLVDIKDIIVDSSVESLGQNPAVRFTTLDLTKTSAFEEAIHQKIAGWELEDVNLLEAELEINARELETAAANTLLRHMMKG